MTQYETPMFAFKDTLANGRGAPFMQGELPSPYCVCCLQVVHVVVIYGTFPTSRGPWNPRAQLGKMQETVIKRGVRKTLVDNKSSLHPFLDLIQNISGKGQRI